MKKITLFIVILIIPVFTFAQNLKLGIMASPQITWLSAAGSNNITKDKSKLGIDLGLAIEKYFTDNYAFLSGISLNNIGGSIHYSDSVVISINDEDTDVPGDAVMNYKLQYIKIPVGLKMKTKPIGYFSYFAQLGFEAGVNVKANITIDDLNINDKRVADEINIFNAGYFIGGGIEYNIVGNTSAVLGIQYQNGILDAIGTTSDKVTTPKITIVLGIMF